MKQNPVGKRLELLNSLSDQIVDYMNKSLMDTLMGIEGLEFCSQPCFNSDYMDIYADFDFGHSPEGEDLGSNAVFFDGTLKDLYVQLDRFADSFDIDEHVKLYIGSAGRNGVPHACDLVHDAEMQKEFYESLPKAFDGFAETLSKKDQKALSSPPAQSKEKSSGRS